MSSPTPDRRLVTPSVIIALVLTGGAVICCFIGGVTWIILDRHDPTPLIGMINLFGLSAVGSGIGAAVYYIIGRMKVIEANTNHTTDTLIKAAIASTPPPPDPNHLVTTGPDNGAT